MRLLNIVRLRLRSLFSRTRAEEELDEELRYHLARQVEEDIARGMTLEEASRAAQRSIAGVEQRKEECRDARGVNLAKLLRGRYFTDADTASKARVVIINRTLARRYFPDEDPIGKQFGDTSLSTNSIKEIVGIVDDIKEGALDSEIWPAVYYPFDQDPDTSFSLVVRTSQADPAVVSTLEAAVHGIDPDIGTARGAIMSERITDSPIAYLRRSSAWLIGGFAAVALVLGAVGLYGVVAYSVSQRTREIGIRLAMGAQRTSVYHLILGEAARLTTIGILVGLVSAVAGPR